MFQVYENKIENTSYGLVLKDMCKTRWYMRYEALNAVYLSFHPLVECLNEEEDDDDDAATHHEAKSLLNKLVSFEFVVLLVFTRQVMTSTNATVTQLQAESLDVLTTIEMLSSLLTLLKNK